MTKHYKRKQYIEADSRDTKGANDLRKHFNASERQRGKKEAYEGLVDYKKEDIKDLKCDIDMEMASACYIREQEATERGEPYTCTCDDPFGWSDDEVLEWLGLK